METEPTNSDRTDSDPKDGAPQADAERQEPGLWPLTWPMALTYLRLLLLPVFLGVLLMGGDSDHVSRYIALGIFAVMAITDQLDGYLARKLNQTSRIGSILDPVADKILIASSVLVLYLSPVTGQDYRIPWYVVVAVYSKDIFVVLGVLLLVKLLGRIDIKPRFLGKLSTTLQLLLVIGTLFAPDMQNLSRSFAMGMVLVLQWTVIAVAVAACVDYYIQGWKLFRSRHSTRAEVAEVKH